MSPVGRLQRVLSLSLSSVNSQLPAFAQLAGLVGDISQGTLQRRYANGTSPHPSLSARGYCASAADEELEPRERMEYDVAIVGAGPAGLACAIRIKQLCEQEGQDLNVCVLEKGAEVGSHILSGNVFEPRALNELFPDWKNMDAPLHTPVTKDKFMFLTEKAAIPLPTPPQMHNDGNYIISLSELTRWLGEQAETAGVEIFPGFAGSEVLYDDQGAVIGVATGDMGISKSGAQKDTFTRGIEIVAQATILAEGCRGSLSQQVMRQFELRKDADPQTYALGVKEVWEVEESKHHAGQVWHSIGWPMDTSTYGGSFLYHMADRKVAIGYVVALDYKNPYLSPYEEFQRFKQHPAVRPLLEGGECLQYGARSLNEGGFQSIPDLTFPGGALVGCAAGFLNVPKIKGSHTAIKSGMLAGEAAFQAVVGRQSSESEEEAASPADLSSYQAALEGSWIWEELYKARNIRPAFQYGMVPGLVNAALDTYLLRGRAPWTLHHKHADNEAIEPAAMHQPKDYPKPDGEVSFDINTSVYRSGTDHEHDQPAHLTLKDDSVPVAVNYAKYAGPEGRFCPARVYEYVEKEDGTGMQLNINAQNCLHCKACDIKDTTQNIVWTVPEGGGGPNYSVM